MPTSVRAARIINFATMGLAVVMTIAVGYVSGAEAAGAVFGTHLMGCVLFIMAFCYHSAGNWSRITSIVLACIQILMALRGAATGTAPGGIFALIGALALIVTLSQKSAGAWFKRPWAA
ncbi:hypothetical protein ACTWJ8_40475 (plasmid) [Streptomyces sp. SDT5-1]|uniref:hypothetical protein n=1 Tax=Streptomyces sp. SDT5-1 TaxID=3406418 RepID=UPI003FD1103A